MLFNRSSCASIPSAPPYAAAAAAAAPARKESRAEGATQPELEGIREAYYTPLRSITPPLVPSAPALEALEGVQPMVYCSASVMPASVSAAAAAAAPVSQSNADPTETEISAEGIKNQDSHDVNSAEVLRKLDIHLSVWKKLELMVLKGEGELEQAPGGPRASVGEFNRPLFQATIFKWAEIALDRKELAREFGIKPSANQIKEVLTTLAQSENPIAQNRQLAQAMLRSLEELTLKPVEKKIKGWLSHDEASVQLKLFQKKIDPQLWNLFIQASRERVPQSDWFKIQCLSRSPMEIQKLPEFKERVVQDVIFNLITIACAGGDITLEVPVEQKKNGLFHNRALGLLADQNNPIEDNKQTAKARSCHPGKPTFLEEVYYRPLSDEAKAYNDSIKSVHKALLAQATLYGEVQLPESSDKCIRGNPYAQLLLGSCYLNDAEVIKALNNLKDRSGTYHLYTHVLSKTKIKTAKDAELWIRLAANQGLLYAKAMHCEQRKELAANECFDTAQRRFDTVRALYLTGVVPYMGFRLAYQYANLDATMPPLRALHDAAAKKDVSQSFERYEIAIKLYKAAVQQGNENQITKIKTHSKEKEDGVLTAAALCANIALLEASGKATDEGLAENFRMTLKARFTKS